MDRRPKPSDIPQELLDLIQAHWRWLCEQWDAKYHDNPVEGSEEQYDDEADCHITDVSPE
jgi:hypothetical protein